ncbi:MAG: hypothetical protein WCH31_08685 [Actinomycetes bacterium]
MRILLATLAACLWPAVAAAAGPAAKHTGAGTTAAQSSLLTLNDLGKGWEASKPGTTAINLSCTGHVTDGSDITEIGAASSPAFDDSRGVVIGQQTSVFADARQTTTYWKRGVDKGLVECVAASLAGLRVRGLGVVITSKTTLPLSRVTEMTEGYRVVAKVTAGSRKLTATFDVILVARGQMLSEIALGSFGSPIPLAVETAFAKIVASRLGSPVA